MSATTTDTATAEETRTGETRTVRCPFCDALIPVDEHWSNCPAAPDAATADDDLDSDKGF